MIERGLVKLQQKYESNLRKSVTNIKKYINFINPWRVNWIRKLVYSTPANLQTSLWRL